MVELLITNTGELAPPQLSSLENHITSPCFPSTLPMSIYGLWSVVCTFFVQADEAPAGEIGLGVGGVEEIGRRERCGGLGRPGWA